MSSPTRTPATTRSARATMLAGLFVLAIAALTPSGAAQPGQPTDLLSSDGCTAFHYVVNNVNYTTLPSNLPPNALLDVVLTVAAPDHCGGVYALVAFDAVLDGTIKAHAVVASSIGTFGVGVHVLSVPIPPCLFQISLLAGANVPSLLDGPLDVPRLDAIAGVSLNVFTGGTACGASPGPCTLLLPFLAPVGATMANLTLVLSQAASVIGHGGLFDVDQPTLFGVKAHVYAFGDQHLLRFDVDPGLIDVTIDYLDGTAVVGEYASLHFVVAAHCGASATTTTTAVPVFPTGTALALGVGGSMAGAFALMRRRK